MLDTLQQKLAQLGMNVSKELMMEAISKHGESPEAMIEFILQNQIAVTYLNNS